MTNTSCDTAVNFDNKNKIFVVHSTIPQLTEIEHPFKDHYWHTTLKFNDIHNVQYSNLPSKEKFACSQFIFPNVAHDPDNIAEYQTRQSYDCRYTLDCMDYCFIDWFNKRIRQRLPGITADEFEIVITKLEDYFLGKIYKEYGLAYTFDNDICCDICRGDRVSSIDDMLVCDGCDVAVHSSCYNVAAKPNDKKPWLCLPCIENVRPKCIYCICRKGAFKTSNRSNHNRWVHESCSYFISQKKTSSHLNATESRAVISETKTFDNTLCSLCFSKYGKVVKCSSSDCCRYFHITCALDAGLYLKRQFSSKNKLKTVYCAIHMLKAQVTSDQCHYLADKPDLPSFISLIRQSKCCILRKLDIFDIMKNIDIRKNLSDVVIYWKERKLAQSCDNLTGFVSNLPRLKRDEISRLAAISDSTMQFIILRQSLESVRHLCYMLIKREKIKQSLNDCQHTMIKLKLRHRTVSALSSSVKEHANRTLLVKKLHKENYKSSTNQKKHKEDRSSIEVHPIVSPSLSDSDHKNHRISNHISLTSEQCATSLKSAMDCQDIDDRKRLANTDSTEYQPSLPKLLYFENGSF
ncbi:hypothetical protein GJ496_002496 [Pomphorhynchus laevis]|nr:hypothetical protein GJ496_002496 [Pomphorhynchus laevis]